MGKKARHRGSLKFLRNRPRRAALKAAPIDLIHRYLTRDELGESAGPPEVIERWIAAADQETALREAATLIGRLDNDGLPGWAEAERQWINSRVLEPHRSNLLRALTRNTTVMGPQAVMILAKRWLKSGRKSGVLDMAPLPLAAILVQGELGPTPDELDEQGRSTRQRLEGEALRSQHFHRQVEEGGKLAQSQIRWHDLAAGEGLPADVEQAFEQVTGVSLLDFQSLGFFLFMQGRAHAGAVLDLEALRARIDWERERLDRTLALMSAPMTQVAEALREDEAEHGQDWTFDPLRQFPIIPLEGDRILIFSPRFVLERTLGWLPFLDMTRPANPSEDTKKAAARAKTAFERIGERDVLLSLRANIDASKDKAMLFDGDELRAAYPEGEIADAVIAYRDAWVVVEVSTGQLSRATVTGSDPQTLDRDLARLIDTECGQIEETIAKIRADPAALLSEDASRQRRFVPVLIITEGLPVNPLTFEAITQRLAASGRPTGPDIEQLHILNTEDLYAAEAMAEINHVGLRKLLREHAGAHLLRRVDLQSWLVMTGQMPDGRAGRIQAALDAAFDRLGKNVGVNWQAMKEASETK